MSLTRQHAEWLALTPVSGPFLSMSVLQQRLPDGLEPHVPEVFAAIKEYGKANGKPFAAGNVNDVKKYALFILQNILDFNKDYILEGQSVSQTLYVELPQHQEILSPDFVIQAPQNNTPRLLIKCYPPNQKLTSPVTDKKYWKASPDTRMTELLRNTGVRLGLITNGEHWMLVNVRQGDAVGFASWYHTTWLEERLTLRSFRTFLSMSRFFNQPDETTLEGLLDESITNQQDVTDKLGEQVRKAVEVLIRTFDIADQDENGQLLADMPPEKLYEAALTVMMRLVFLFCAEERELIPSQPYPVYEQHYSVASMGQQLREIADKWGEEILGFRYDAWARLIANFRMIYNGVRHDEITMPRYGGELFDPDRYPFLEGRKNGTSWENTESVLVPVDNRTVLHLLEALQILKMKNQAGGKIEAQRLSFRSLDIEQIGHVYEGLLDHTVKRATEPILCVAGTGDPDVPLAKLESFKTEKERLKFLAEETGKTETAIKNLLAKELNPQEDDKLRASCQNNKELYDRVKPYGGIIRLDTFERPLVINEGSVFVTSGTDRRNTGTHYTPRSLTEPIVQLTLEPLVYNGAAEGLPKSEWTLKSADEILALKICDPACGSGAFLVQAARYLADILLTANAPQVVDANEDNADERRIEATRLVVHKCLYGVDKNPLAAEMAKLSLWLLTFAKDQPFEFLDHSIRCGDSLAGLTAQQIKACHWDGNAQKDLFSKQIDNRIQPAMEKLREIRNASQYEQYNVQEENWKAANNSLNIVRFVGDAVLSTMMSSPKEKERERELTALRAEFNHYLSDSNGSPQRPAIKPLPTNPFHWEIEFPDVFEDGGFDAIIGNPPYIQLQKNGGVLGKIYENLGYKTFTATGDIYCLFYERAYNLLKPKRNLGFITSNKWMRAGYGENLRQFLAANTNPLYLVDFAGVKAFSATVDVNVLIYSKEKNRYNTLAAPC